MSKNNGCAEENKTGTDKHMRILKVTFLLYNLLYVLITLLISVTGIIVLYQGLTDKIKPLNMAVILLGLVVMQQMITAIRDFVLKNWDKRNGMHLLSCAKVMVPRGEFVDLGVKAGEDIYEKGIIPTNALSKRECVYIVEVEIGEFKEAPVVNYPTLKGLGVPLHRLSIESP